VDESAILTKLTEIFHEVFDDPSIVLTLTTTAEDVADWDSMSHLTLVIETERRFGVKFNTAELDELKNVGEFVRLIAGKLAKAP
jgi:acyl carrier protein